MKTGALLLASFEPGKKDTGDAEMSPFLPMYQLDGTTVIKREIAALRQAGISPIVVLTGYQKEVLRNHLSHHNVIFVENEKYLESDPTETLQIGLKAAMEWMDKAVAVPVEYPAFSPQTLELLVNCKKSTIPIYNGQSGWPRLFALKKNDWNEPELLPVEDVGILLSLLNEGGLQQAEQYLKALRYSNTFRIKTKVILTKKEDFFGPGIYHLLQYIDETGSIQSAAAKMNMSYSKAWKMVNKVEKEMDFPFLKRSYGGKKGGNSTLTEEGRLFIERYHSLEEDLKRIGQELFNTYFKGF